MSIIRLTTASDERLRAYTHLTERQLRDNLETTSGVLVAESEKVIRVALAEGLELLSLLIEDHHLKTRQELVELALAQGSGGDVFERAGHLSIEQTDSVPVYVLPKEELSALVGYTVTRGIHALFRRPAPLTVPSLLEQRERARRICVLEGVTDATNVGAAFRSAAALGVDAVLLDPTCCDPYVRRALRVSMGTIFQVPWARFDVWPAGLDLLHEQGFTLAALALKNDSHSLGEPELKSIDKLAMIFGTEGDGLSDSTIKACDVTIKIPMAHGVDSLNVAAASAVAFWELCR